MKRIDAGTVDAITALIIFCVFFIGMILWCIEIRYGG